MRKQKRWIAALLAVMVFAGSFILVPAQEAEAVTKTEINNLKALSKELNKKINGVQSQLKELNTQEQKTLAQKELYDVQCALISEQIMNTEMQIEEYNDLIEEAKKEYEEAVIAEEEQHAIMCERIRAMEERGAISYLEILFGARSFADLLSRLDFIDEVMKFDEAIIASYEAYQQETIERRAELGVLIDEAEEAKAELESQKDALIEKLEEAEALMLEIQSNQEEYEKLLQEYSDEEDALQDKIAKAEAEYAEQIRQQQQASGQGNSAEGISFIWPCDSRRITSYFGPRSSSSTNGVGSTNHKGIDIGGVGYTSKIYSVASGVVTIAQYSKSAGNYVTVSHGNGVTSVYMHMSSISVSVGQKVSQGTVVGISGNTGNSTGPHLHFGIAVGGVYKDPLNYLP